MYGHMNVTYSYKLWAPALSSFLVRNFLAKNEMTVVPQPPYSPDLAPADFFLFFKLKSTLKWRRFETTDEIQKNSRNDLFAILTEAFQKAFQSWQKRWERCVASEINYKACPNESGTDKFMQRFI
jgi:hypothetical protein